MEPRDGGHVTVDDLAVARAREKLATLRERPGYDEALQARASDNRKERRLSILICLAMIALTVIVFWQVETTWLKWTLAIVLVAVAALAAFSALAFSDELAPRAVPAMILDKWRGDRSVPFLALLDEQGARIDAIAYEAVWEMTRIGDVGVAHVRDSASPSMPASVIAIHRL